MNQLVSQLKLKDLVVVDSREFESVWAPYQHKEADEDAITGLKGYYSYRMLGGYKGRKAIIKGIWSTVAEEKVIQGGFCLHDKEMLLAFFIDPESRGDRPKYIFVIDDSPPGYFHEYEAPGLTVKKANSLRTLARESYIANYEPEPSL